MKRETHYTHAQSVLQDWGQWARRPQFWARLRVSGMYAAIPLKDDPGRPPMAEIALSPQSREVHRAVMAMDDALAGILYAYYVRQVSFDDKPYIFRQFGIGRTKFYEMLRDATLMAYNRSRHIGIGVDNMEQGLYIGGVAPAR